MRTFVLGGIAMALTACATAPNIPAIPPAQIAIPTYPGGSIVTDSRTGKFFQQGQCLLFRDSAGHNFLPVLKSGSFLAADILTIAGPVHKKTVRIGERVTIEGGGQDWLNVPQSYQLTSFKTLCSVPPFFVINAK